MNWASFIFGSVALIIQQFADQDKLLDLAKTVAELNNDLSIPRIATYDFIIGKKKMDIDRYGQTDRTLL
jgi:hypothetical protein